MRHGHVQLFLDNVVAMASNWLNSERSVEGASQ